MSHQPGATLGELVSAVGLCPSPGFRGLVDWLDLLVSVGCLTRTGAWGTCVKAELPGALAVMGVQGACITTGLPDQDGCVGLECNLAACMQQKGAHGGARKLLQRGEHVFRSGPGGQPCRVHAAEKGAFGDGHGSYCSRYMHAWCMVRAYPKCYLMLPSSQRIWTKCPSSARRFLYPYGNHLVPYDAGEGDEARYGNTEVAGTYLVQGRPQYMGECWWAGGRRAGEHGGHGECRRWHVACRIPYLIHITAHIINLFAKKGAPPRTFRGGARWRWNYR